MNMKNRYLFILILSLFTIPLLSASLFQIRSNIGVSKQRLVFDIDGSINYKVSKDKRSVIIEINNCFLPAKVKRQKIEGRFINNFKLRKEGSRKVVATFTLVDDYKFNVFRMKNVVVDKNKNIKGDKIVLDVSGKRKSSKRKSVKTKDTEKKVSKLKKTVKPAKKKEIKPTFTLASVIDSYQNKKYMETIKLATGVLKAKPRLLAAKYYRALSQKALASLNKNSKNKLKLLKTAAASLENVLADSAGFVEARTAIVEIYRLLKDDDKALEHNMIFMSYLDNKQSEAGSGTSKLLQSQHSEYSGIVDSSKLELQPENIAKTKEELEPLVEDKLESPGGESTISISLGLDQNIRDRVCELFDDGFTNREIAEALEISKDEVDFVIRSIDEEDNEKKKDKEEYLNEELTGVSEVDNVGDIAEEVLRLKEEGFSAQEIAEKLEKNIGEVDFILSIDEKKKAGMIKTDIEKQETVVSDTEERESSAADIISLAKQGLSKKEIAEKLLIGLDEVEFAVSLYDIPLKKEDDGSKKSGWQEDAVETQQVEGAVKTKGIEIFPEEAVSEDKSEFQDEKELIDRIILLAKQGYSKQKIAKELSISIDEVEFAAALHYDINFVEEPIAPENEEAAAGEVQTPEETIFSEEEMVEEAAAGEVQTPEETQLAVEDKEEEVPVSARESVTEEESISSEEEMVEEAATGEVQTPEETQLAVEDKEGEVPASARESVTEEGAIFSEEDYITIDNLSVEKEMDVSSENVEILERKGKFGFENFS